ncbi:prohibitin family protein [Candidatus Bathyarchaeota archaeon]|nr:prohibitin family protein [Candidatus Bathyarchaeota archaeon]
MERRFQFEGPRLEGAGIIALVLIVIVGGLMFFSVGRINVGYVAVIVDPVFGSTSVVGTGGNAQYFLKFPWASVYKIYVATDSVHMWSDQLEAGDFPAVESLTKDGLKVDVDITVRWRIAPAGAANLFQRYPTLDWKDRAIIPIIRETIRNLLVDYSAIETIEKRANIGLVLKENLEKAFKEEPSIGDAVILDAVNIRKIALPATFVNAIEKKLAAEQLSIAAEFNKTRLLVIADANAQSAILEAQGVAQSRLIVANATRQALAVIAGNDPEINLAELTKLYLYLETLRSIADTGKGQFIIVPDKSQYILPIS